VGRYGGRPLCGRSPAQHTSRYRTSNEGLAGVEQYRCGRHLRSDESAIPLDEAERSQIGRCSMTDDWVTAAEALRRVSDASDRVTAPRTICSRAYAGLIEAKALKLIWTDRIGDHCEVPAAFWWARGEAALEQNW